MVISNASVSFMRCGRGEIQDLSVLQPFIKCACPVYPLHIHSIMSFIHLHVFISQYVSKLRHFPDSQSLAYMYKIYLHFIEKTSS